MKIDYHSITETPGLKADFEQMARIYHRYRFALDYAETKDLLEAACGTGMGLGYLGQKARSVVGGDIDKKNVSVARTIHKDSPIKIQAMDAHDIPYADHSFDLILLFEAIYYLERPEVFVKEAFRVLRDGGILIICTVNKDWADFHPSQYAHKYYSVPELYSLLKGSFRKIKFYGAFTTQTKGIFAYFVSYLKRAAVQFNLVPGSLAARAYLKRLIFGVLKPLPDQVFENMSPYEPPVLIPADVVNSGYKIIYAVAEK